MGGKTEQAEASWIAQGTYIYPTSDFKVRGCCCQDNKINKHCFFVKYINKQFKFAVDKFVTI